jgi:hypothetical protein
VNGSTALSSIFGRRLCVVLLTVGAFAVGMRREHRYRVPTDWIVALSLLRCPRRSMGSIDSGVLRSRRLAMERFVR